MNNKVKFLRGTSGEYAVAEKDSDTIYFTTDNGKLYIGDKEISGDGSITIDTELSDTSENVPQTKIVKKALDEKADKTVATTTADGLMSAADKTKLDSADDTYASKAKYGDTTIDVGRKFGTDVGNYSTAEGFGTTASGSCSHAEGSATTASGYYSHAEGNATTASGYYSHAEGNATTASGNFSHAEGDSTTASGNNSHAGGRCTKALNMNEVAYGKYNESNDDTLFSIGDGTSDTARHNAFEITKTGGKLHDKDIATTDIIPDLSAYAKKTDVPNIKVNEAANADTVGGKDPEKIFYDNSMSSDLNSATKSGCYSASPNTLNAPSSSWWIVDTMNFDDQFIVQKAHEIGNTAVTVSYIRNYANGAWSDWTEMYTSGNKPYITGSFSGTGLRTDTFDYQPSFAICNDNGTIKYGGIAQLSNVFQVVFQNLSDTTHEYIIFK